MMGGRPAGRSDQEVRAIAAMRRQAKALKKAGLMPDKDALKLINELAKEKLFDRKDEREMALFG